MADNILGRSMLLLYVMTPVVGLAVNVIIQILSFRCISKIGLLRSVYFGFIAGFCALIVIDIIYWKVFSFLFQEMIVPHITNIIIYAVLGYCYFNFVGLGETARRIRMLTEIYDSKAGLSLEEILNRYNAKEIVEKRIDRLLSNGQLKCKDGKYFIGKPIVLFIADSVISLKLLFLGRKREFDRGPL